jgi:hypothetical protein
VLKIINDLPDVDLAFDKSMNEEQKLKLITDIIGYKFAEGDAELHTDKFSTVDLDSDLIDTIYTKEKFEKAVTQELNDLIQDATVTFES